MTVKIGVWVRGGPCVGGGESEVDGEDEGKSAGDCRRADTCVGLPASTVRFNGYGGAARRGDRIMVRVIKRALVIRTVIAESFSGRDGSV